MATPRATYRIQLRPDFGFEDTAAVADYLARLGVSHLYASPYLHAAEGSTHGYDVVDPTRVSEALGGEEGHAALLAALERQGLRQVLDIVPNHMAVTRENAWWWDLLRNGPASRFAHVFDVDWDPPEPKLRNQVLLPILGDHYGRELEAGRVALRHADGVFTLQYEDHVAPVAPRSLAPVLARAAGSPALANADADELAFLARALARLPEAATPDAAERAARQRDLEAIDRRLGTMAREVPGVAAALDAAVASVNAEVDALDEVVSAQNYRLAYWRTAGQELDYRRFFDIHTLAGLRTEDLRVFEAVHARALEWVREGALDGLRVDHPDGLRRPAEYFRRLREAAPEAWIVAEKILAPGEALRPWPVDGTTGYDALNAITAVFLDPAGEEPFTDIWRELTGDARSYHDVALEARLETLREGLAADVSRLANVFVQVCEERRRHRDFTRRELREALVEVAASFPVYRSYVEESGEAEPADVEVVERAIGAAAARRPDLDAELLDLLRAVLVGEAGGDAARGLRMRFQQLTGPVAAKGEEDTAFYRYLRFAALNEVGGAPGRWGVDVAAFHESCRRAAGDWPRTMTALSTHDTKRSEDVRARLLVLAEIPGRWGETVRRWRAAHADHWTAGVDPDPAMEYLFYQTVVGAWPIDADRLAAYMGKASREAKVRTSWTDPDPAYDDALRRFVTGVREDPVFDEDVGALVKGLVGPGRVVSLAQKLVQLTMPGVPDVYQGSELWDLSLVDPDNRRPVDFQARRDLLAELEAASGKGAPPFVRELLGRMDEGAPKLWVVREALRARAERPHAFEGGAYEPLEMAGPAADHALGFLRGDEVAVVVPRLVVGLVRGGGWQDTTVALPSGRWESRLTGDGVEAGREGVVMERVLGRFPVALLVRAEGGRVAG
ncbi:MAG TPA: malto-oligosyltrehalose synthase [Longimicrobiales bacterium]|nr:malto-oligosyltrehalose synthase [Longimicrobiales bacterium]